jgi:hypothetical protein
MIIVLAIRLEVRGFKPSPDNGFLEAIKIRSTTSFGREVQLPALFHKNLRHVNVPLRYNKNRPTDRQNSAAISHPVSIRFVTSVSAATENSGGRIGND